MSTPVRFAVIVGIDDYHAFDASQGKPRGTSDLRGSVNDAGLYLDLARTLGVPAEGTRVLVAPANSAGRPARFKGVEGGAPTHDNIQAAVEWLIASLEANPGTQAMLTYSGHGDAEDAHLVLCPTDMTANKDHSLNNALHLAGLGGMLDRVAEKNMITVFLDCCHAGEAAPGVRGLRAASRPQIKTRQLSNGHPVLAACRATALSSEINFGETHYGAFSWAVTQVLSRWQESTDSSGAEVGFGIAYGEVPERTSMLLNAMAIEQSPVYEGTALQRGACVFTRADQHVEPPQPDGHRELFPGDTGIYRIYYLYDDNGNHIISILATGANYAGAEGYAANMEYWELTTNAVSTLKTTPKVQFANYHTSSSASSKPSSNGFASLGGQSYSLTAQTFAATTSSQSFAFNRLFEREDGQSGMGFVWDGGDIKAINWFHKSSSLIFTGSPNTGSLSDSHFYAASAYYNYQAF